jgi:hypothetical protein
MSLKNPVTPPGIDPGTVGLVAQRLNHYANSGPTKVAYRQQNGIADGVSGFKPLTFQSIFDVRKQKENARCKVWTVSRM